MTRFNIVEEWALAKEPNGVLWKTVTVGFRVDEWDDSFEPAYCRSSSTFKSHDEAKRFVDASQSIARIVSNDASQAKRN